jgi:hypothetical protein
MPPRTRADNSVLKGKILILRADLRLTDSHGSYRPNARYNIQTDDGTYVYVPTEGPTLSDGRCLLRAKVRDGDEWVLNWSGGKVFIDMSGGRVMVCSMSSSYTALLTSL